MNLFVVAHALSPMGTLEMRAKPPRLPMGQIRESVKTQLTGDKTYND